MILIAWVSRAAAAGVAQKPGQLHKKCDIFCLYWAKPGYPSQASISQAACRPDADRSVRARAADPTFARVKSGTPPRMWEPAFHLPRPKNSPALVDLRWARSTYR